MKPILSLALPDFHRAMKSNELFPKLDDAFRARLGFSASPAEKASWFGSLPRLSGLLELSELPDSVVIGLEVQIPYYSERIDAVLYGHNEKGLASVVLIELKQWSAVEAGDDGRVAIRMRNGLVQVVHPSLQVDGYRNHLKNFVKAFHTEYDIQIDGCVYLRSRISLTHEDRQAASGDRV